VGIGDEWIAFASFLSVKYGKIRERVTGYDNPLTQIIDPSDFGYAGGVVGTPELRPRICMMTCGLGSACGQVPSPPCPINTSPCSSPMITFIILLFTTFIFKATMHVVVIKANSCHSCSFTCKVGCPISTHGTIAS